LQQLLHKLHIAQQVYARVLSEREFLFGDVYILHCAIQIKTAQILFIAVVWNSCCTWLWENDVQYLVWM